MQITGLVITNRDITEKRMSRRKPDVYAVMSVLFNLHTVEIVTNMIYAATVLAQMHLDIGTAVPESAAQWAADS